jgi:hypothetical protein
MVNQVKGTGAVQNAAKLSTEMKGVLKANFEEVIHSAQAQFTPGRPREMFSSETTVEKPIRFQIGGSTFSVATVDNGQGPNKATQFFIHRESGSIAPPNNDVWAGPFDIHQKDPKAKHGGLTQANFDELKSLVDEDAGKKSTTWSDRLPGVDMRYLPVDIQVPAKGVDGGETLRAWFPAGIAGQKFPVDLNKLMEQGAQFFIERDSTMAPPNGGSKFAGPFSTHES